MTRSGGGRAQSDAWFRQAQRRPAWPTSGREV